jgi:asparagine synthase (glutamine-hydrolysing)
MCGIAGIFNLDGRLCEPSDVGPLIDALAHRGPDGSGIYTHASIGLGHRRLAILDLSESGKQPMQFGDRYWITYNGEVYNFVELRRELETHGHRFSSDTDTEVVVAAYHQWGPECVLKMNGMWAFAIWDSHRRELFLSRDRFGVKPIHFLSEPARFVFASELKSFLHLRGFTPRENEEETCRQLTGLGESPDETLLEGVKLLRPGHSMVVSGSGTRIWRWWCTLDHLVDVPRRFSDQVEQFRDLFMDACRLRLRSDVPVATCLSGGLDSSSILCTLAAMNKTGTSRLTSDYHHAFVATFEGTEHDELEFAQAAIEKAGAIGKYRPMHPGELTQDLPQFAYDLEMIGTGLLLPVWALYRELRRAGVVVTLDGLGADELLMGYGASLKKLLVANGNMIRRPLRTLDLARTLQRQFPKDASVTRILAESDPSLRHLHAAVRSVRRTLKRVPVKTPIAKPEWFKPWVSTEDEMDASERISFNKLTPINQVLYRQFHYGVNQSLLRKYDRMSMSHGIEVRMPFLDWRLVTFAFSLPDESKVGGGYSKRILREAMRGILPEKIRTRTVKIGFQSPLSDWVNGDLGDWVAQRVQTKHFLESKVSNGPAIRDFVTQRHTEKGWDGGNIWLIWRHLQADLWREAFFPALNSPFRTVGRAIGPSPDRRSA